MSLVFPEVAAPAPPLPGRSMEPPEPPRATYTPCACGCGEDVQPDEYEHYRDADGNLFAHRECVDRYYGIQYVGR